MIRHSPLIFFLFLSFAVSQAATKGTGPKPAASTPDYARALAAADKFLQSWQSGDVESGTVLLTAHAKEKISSDALENLFATSAPSAYEITHGKQLRPGRYQFPIVLFEAHSARHRFSSIVVLNTGHNDWAIDKLP